MIIDYLAKEDFTRTVFTIENREIIEHTLSEICRAHADQTTSPRGVEPRFHTRGNELWTWGVGGSHPSLVMACDTEAQAEHALLLSFQYDLDHAADGPTVYDTREEAQAALKDLSDDHDCDI